MQQTKMGFAMDAGEVAERRNMLGLAVLRLHGIDPSLDPLRLRELLMWVFNTTACGSDGELRKSVAELASLPWGLGCSEVTVKRLVRFLKKNRVLRVVENRYQSDGQTANSHSIDWDGIRVLLGLRHGPGGLKDLPSGLKDLPSGLKDLPFKEETPLPDPLLLNSGPEAGPNREEKSQLREEPGIAVTADGTDADWLRAELIAEIPELQAAAAVSVPPAPPGDLLYGVYAGLTLTHVNKPLMMAVWLRQQLGTRAPVMEGTEADVLLAMAAAFHAAAIDGDKVHNRVAVLVTVISRRLWRKVTPFVRKASQLLAAAKAQQQAIEV